MHKCSELCVHISSGRGERHLQTSLDSRQPQMGRVASDQVHPMKFKLSSLSCQKIGPSLHLLSSHMVPCLHTENSQLFPNHHHAKPRIPYISTLHCKTTREVFSKDLLTSPDLHVPRNRVCILSGASVLPRDGIFAHRVCWSTV